MEAQAAAAPLAGEADPGKTVFVDLLPRVLAALRALCTIDKAGNASGGNAADDAKQQQRAGAWGDGRELRVLSSCARAAFDCQLENLLLKDGYCNAEGERCWGAEDAVRAAAGLLNRGCRPRAVVVDLRGGEEPAARQERL
jgi:hypothetical protein